MKLKAGARYPCDKCGTDPEKCANWRGCVAHEKWRAKAWERVTKRLKEELTNENIEAYRKIHPLYDAIARYWPFKPHRR